MISNRETPQLEFSFNGQNIPIVNSHKHLGVTLSNDGKWNTHIDNIVTSAMKHINVMRKIKYKICRTTLEKLYLTYIRPILEYACEVWDNCGIVYTNKLENVQLEAARIITGLPIFTKKERIYEEIGWETLKERRNRRKLQIFYNINNKIAPRFLCDLIPPTIQSTTVYPLRNGEDIILPFCRLSLTNESFIPSTIREWNKLDHSIRNLDTLSKFKSVLKRKNNQNIPLYYSYGPRKLNIILTQLRCQASFLNHDLHRVNIITDSSCRCGNVRETRLHYFLECPQYVILRNQLFESLSWLPNNIIIDINLLLCGNENLTERENELIFDSVFEYIKKSKRFLAV